MLCDLVVYLVEPIGIHIGVQEVSIHMFLDIGTVSDQEKKEYYTPLHHYPESPVANRLELQVPVLASNRGMRLLLSPKWKTRSCTLMSTSAEAEQDASVLGKRARNGGEEPDKEMADVGPPADAAEEDDSDDDVGPMPMPAEAANGGVKKKRKGATHSV